MASGGQQPEGFSMVDFDGKHAEPEIQRAIRPPPIECPSVLRLTPVSTSNL
ncbi:hypothetical protein FRC12_012972 [Ceratobasidium sp. 428]|nr:hypothetical protein FRC12_012972 [Ceratobasidium sp. 428]